MAQHHSIFGPHGRCIAPDLIGMGKSDKPNIDYRFIDHAAYLDQFIETLGLSNITLVIHDWGSALGFHYAQRHPDNIKAICFMEALIMPTPSYEVMGEQGGQLFKAFRTPGIGEQMLIEQNIFIEQVLPGSVIRQFTAEEMNHYRAPFLDPAHRQPVYRWPNEVPIAGAPADVHNIVASYNQWLQETDLPKLLFYATPGAIIMEPLVGWCQQFLSNLTMIDIGPGVHYLQEDNPHLIGRELAQWVQALAPVSA